MRLLIWVNKFDENDDLLGFFVGWVKELALHLDSIIVVTQHLGKHEGELGLKVIAIDKSQMPNSVGRVFKFITLLFRLRADYDGVLVIMSPTWTVVAFLLTKILGKKLYLWYAVWRGSLKLSLAEKVVNKIFCSVQESFPFVSKKVIPIGQGINVDLFVPDEAVRESGRILFLGRISPIKKIESLLQAIAKLKYYDTMIYHRILLEIVGGVANEDDDKYLLGLKRLAQELGVSEKIVWAGRIPHSVVKRCYQRADIFVNLTPTGSFDKTMLEAMSCGDIILASNQALAKFLDEEQISLLTFVQDDSDDLANKLISIFKLGQVEKDKLRQELRHKVVVNHSQKQWALNLTKNL